MITPFGARRAPAANPYNALYAAIPAQQQKPMGGQQGWRGGPQGQPGGIDPRQRMKMQQPAGLLAMPQQSAYMTPTIPIGMSSKNLGFGAPHMGTLNPYGNYR